LSSLFYYIEIERKSFLNKRQKSLVLLGVVTTIVSILFQVINDSLISTPLSYHRALFTSQIYWQWITSSLVHVNWNHWFLNIMNLYVILFIFHEAWSIKKILLLFFTFSLFITLCIHYCVTDINSYVGMSGILYGLTVYGALWTFPKQKTISFLILSYILIKLIFPKYINSLIGIDEIVHGFYIVTEAHIYGAILGLGFYFLEIRGDNGGYYTNEKISPH